MLLVLFGSSQDWVHAGKQRRSLITSYRLQCCMDPMEASEMAAQLTQACVCVQMCDAICV